MKQFKYNIAIGAALMMVSPYLVEAKKMSGDDISNLIIEGENRLVVHATLPEFTWSTDIYKGLPQQFKDNRVIGYFKPGELTEPPLVLPKKSTTKKAGSPWLKQIYSKPVVTLSVQSRGEDRKVDWIFKVKDSQGKVFYQQKKRSIIPPEIKWDGFGRKKKPIQVGYDYTYQLYIIDEAGNPQRYAGFPFNIESFRFNKSGYQITRFKPEALFTGQSTLKFSKEGFQFLVEVKDTLRNRYGQRLNVIVYDRDQKFALARAKAIRRFLVKALSYPESKITAQGLAPKEGEGYRYVDIKSK